MHGHICHPTFVWWLVTEGTYTIANPSFTCHRVFTLATAGVRTSGLNWMLYWRTISPPSATLRHYRRRWQSTYVLQHMFAEYPAPFPTLTAPDPHHTYTFTLSYSENRSHSRTLIPRTPSLGMSVPTYMCTRGKVGSHTLTSCLLSSAVATISCMKLLAQHTDTVVVCCERR